MFHMLFFRLGVHQHIIDKNHGKLIKVLHEYLVHETHVSK
jgi:hypothetical protein